MSYQQEQVLVITVEDGHDPVDQLRYDLTRFGRTFGSICIIVPAGFVIFYVLLSILLTAENVPEFLGMFVSFSLVTVIGSYSFWCFCVILLFLYRSLRKSALFPWKMTIDEEGMTLHFKKREKRIPWSQVEEVTDRGWAIVLDNKKSDMPFLIARRALPQYDLYQRVYTKCRLYMKGVS